MTKKNNRKEIIKKVADRLKKMLKTEGSNWKKNSIWEASDFSLPMNANTKKAYSGFNIITYFLKSKKRTMTTMSGELLECGTRWVIELKLTKKQLTFFTMINLL